MQEETASIIHGRKFSAFLLLLAGIVASCRSHEEPPAPPLRPVRYIEVVSTAGRRVRSFSGVARANVESNLSFRVSGNIRRLPIEVGDRVGQGQIIAELDPTDFELQVQEAEAALLQAQAQARRAEADYERVRGLYENRNAARSDLDAARAAAESARAQIDASVQRLEQARSQLSYTRLRAPLGGSIAAVDIEVNENVQSGQRVAMLTSGSRPEVQVAVPETLIGELQVGSDVDVSFDALGERDYPATITKVGVAATGVATTFPVTVQLLEATLDVRSGMAAHVAFTFGGGDDRERFLLPAHAVAEDREGRFVFVVEPTEPGRGKVHRRTVTVGLITGEGLEVLGGLAAGELVVTAGVSQIHDGLEVKLEEDGQT
jgi:RND family efflux transporter MFP subunit